MHTRVARCFAAAKHVSSFVTVTCVADGWLASDGPLQKLAKLGRGSRENDTGHWASSDHFVGVETLHPHDSYTTVTLQPHCGRKLEDSSTIAKKATTAQYQETMYCAAADATNATAAIR